MTAEAAPVPTVPGGWLLGSATALQDDQLATYLDAMHTHGSHVRFRVGPPRIGFVFDAVFSPEGARQVLGAREDRWIKQAPVLDEFTHLFGEGLGSSTGHLWLTHRRILQPVFTRRHVEQSMRAIVSAAEDVVADWVAAGPGAGVDLSDASMRYSLRALGRSIFGADDLDRAWPVLQWTLPLLSDHAATRGLAPVRLPRSWPTPANRRAARARRALHELVDDLVRTRRAATDDHDLLGLLLAARDPDTGRGLDDREVRDEVLIFLSAGHETTGSSLALVLHLLGRHPRVQHRVREEVRRVLGDRTPRAADLDDLQYTGQVVDEALRLYPPLHTLVRRAARDTRLLGHEVPEGRVAAVSTWGIHRNPAVWPDPARFDPTRFDPDRDHDRHAHVPYGAGPRSCIGVHLATAELVVAVALVVRAFRLSADDREPELMAGVTLRSRRPLRAVLVPPGRAEHD
ncbi:cytochrome P450 [Salsipaludibacter albus]|uniref:cytochrome P450 n=1 Tax=Salsipaludibacter albus TaxID=2849650 RepID=UPI001EE4702E|nr:cytochrome P450 [Salsipaludibacter albus]MBY5161001.1 cytochrome P450 [Salsipaludibacter albus]